jgi:fermentation-respiration switch protein FrsA (DUF1100 family)/quercetin dioxygenase-like cupin family protein
MLSEPPTLPLASVTFPSADASSLSLNVDLSTASVGGTLLLPRTSHAFPCVVIVGGTLSQLRDGELLRRPNIPPRTALKRLAESLAAAGYGSFRYDQIGQGSSRAKPGYKDLYAGDAEVLAGIYHYLRGRPECSRIIAAGESAGAYIISLAARAGAHADAYLFLGGFCGKAEEIFEYNFDRLYQYAGQSEERAAWARDSHLDREMAFGKHWREMLAAAHAGETEFEVVDGGYRQTVDLARRREELDFPPDDMFAYVKGPALALAGTRDLNVAPHHAACAVAVMQRAGNLKSQAVLIEGADHNFQIAPEDADLAFRERYTFASFNRPYHPQLDREILKWLADVAPVVTAVQQSELQPATAFSPARFHLAPGVTLIDDILQAREQAGVDTLEGFIGPLLRTPEMRSHFIDMPAGLFLDEHPHAKGSIIYTVRGQWGLKSLGRWHLMKPGSLYWFGDNIPTGFQVPFQEDAFILIFKATPGDDDETFVRYLERLAEKLQQEQSAGTVFRLVDLPPGDAALEFARQVNPLFDQEF